MLVLLLLVVCSSAWCSAQEDLSVKNEEEFLKDFEMYTNLDKLLAFLRNETNPLAQEILDTFLTNCVFTPRHTSRGLLMKPIIVIEGNHKASRDVVVMGLSQMLKARYITHPAPCIHKYHKLLPRGTALRRAYYLLSNYAASFYAKSQLHRPIIINGYWTEQLVFILTHYYPLGALPSVSSDIFKFPEDLLKPDLIFYLDFPDKLIYSHVTTKSPLTWKPRVMEAFRHLQGRYPVIIKEVKPFFKLTTEEIHRQVREHMYSKVFGAGNVTAT